MTERPPIDVNAIMAEVQARLAPERERLARLGAAPLTEAAIAATSDDDLAHWVSARLPDFDFDDRVALSHVPEEVRAYQVTEYFEFEWGNGGLHQFFYNNPNPDQFSEVIWAYRVLGLESVSELLQNLIAPLAQREAEWRNSLRDGTIETFFESYPDAVIGRYDGLLKTHDAERIAYVRAHPVTFCM